MHSKFLVVAVMAFSSVLSAQEKAPAPEQKSLYEVVSIRPNKSGEQAAYWQTLSNRMILTNLPVKSLVMSGYDLSTESSVIDLPKWASEDPYNIEIKWDEDTVAALKTMSRKESGQWQLRLFQQVLADRFAWKAHTETRMLPSFDLVIAKGGLKVKETATPGSSNTMGAAKMAFQAITMAGLADQLSNRVGRTITDKTGLGQKIYAFTLTWTPDAKLNDSDAGPSIYTALEEQLGLKLVATKAPVEVVVVDHIENPSEN